MAASSAAIGDENVVMIVAFDLNLEGGSFGGGHSLCGFKYEQQLLQCAGSEAEHHKVLMLTVFLIPHTGTHFFRQTNRINSRGMRL